MPRGIRLDAPGAYHHVTARGVEKRAIFMDDLDRHAFLVRLENLVLELRFTCFAWALIPNHFHLVVRRDVAPLAKLVARLNGPFAQSFNRRHARVGHLFQDRFVSRMIEDHDALMVVTRYVLFNPVRHGVVSAKALSRYAWCAYGAIEGARPPRAFEAVAQTLAIFGANPDASRESLRRELRELTPELPWQARVEALIRAECAHRGIPLSELDAKRRAAASVRERVCVVAVRELGVRPAALARYLGISAAAVHRGLARATRSGSEGKGSDPGVSILDATRRG